VRAGGRVSGGGEAGTTAGSSGEQAAFPNTLLFSAPRDPSQLRQLQQSDFAVKNEFRGSNRPRSTALKRRFPRTNWA
jgi:hypothetical protein